MQENQKKKNVQMTTPHRTFRTPSVTSSRLHIHNEPTDEIRTIVQILKPNIERMMRCQLTDVEAVQFSSQHVSGSIVGQRQSAQNLVQLKLHEGLTFSLFI